MTPPRLNLTRIDGERRRYAALRRALVATVQAAYASGEILEVPRNLVEAASSFTQAEVAALVWTACRWSELPTLDWGAPKRGACIHVTMPKVGRTRTGPRPPRGTEAVWHDVPDSIVLPKRRRKTVARHIRDALQRLGLHPPPGIQSGTHAVRHVIASAMTWAGYTKEDVAARLGHQSTSPTAEYIHDKEAWRSP